LFVCFVVVVLFTTTLQFIVSGYEHNKEGERCGGGGGGGGEQCLRLFFLSWIYMSSFISTFIYTLSCFFLL
jgi:hypothetical protein